MVGYIQTMARKEPITLAVMVMMIAILIFGVVGHHARRQTLTPPGRRDRN